MFRRRKEAAGRFCRGDQIAYRAPGRCVTERGLEREEACRGRSQVRQRPQAAQDSFYLKNPYRYGSGIQLCTAPRY